MTEKKDETTAFEEHPGIPGKRKHPDDPREPGLSRRGFLQMASGLGTAAALGGGGALLGCAPKEQAANAAEDGAAGAAVSSADEAKILNDVYNTPKYGNAPALAPLTTQNFAAEPEIPDYSTLEELGLKSEYECDVLVIGGGFAGIHAADRAHELGKKVLLVDKGTVGKSGLTPWAHTFAWFDPELGDDKEYCINGAMKDHEYSGRREYFEMFLDRSKEIYEQGLEWGWLHPHDWSTTDGTDKTPAEMLQEHADIDRHLLFRQHLVDLDIDLVERVMIVDLIKDGDAIVGAVGFHMECESLITIYAKSVIIATGPGSVRPAGFPTGSATWDGDGMAYRAGAKLSGKEYTDFHWTLADFPGDVYSMWWRSFLEGQHLFTAHYETMADMMTDVLVVDQNHGFVTPDRSRVEEVMNADAASVEADTNTGDPRQGLGNTITPDYLWINREVKECATGMGLPKEEGVWPVDDKCWSGVNGLWAAGDALASCLAGSIYVCMGSSTCASAIQGKVCAEQACEYCDTVGESKPSPEVVKAAQDRVIAPYQREVGFSPAWLEEMLCNIMAPYWVAYMKTPETLNAALSQLLTAKEKAMVNLRARDMHELRYCHEMVNKFLSCEAKLRAGLMRTESRGMHYRYDYPYRDDENWMAWITMKQGDDGEMVLEKVPMDEASCGDMSEPYTERYPNRYPGELEALGISE